VGGQACGRSIGVAWLEAELDAIVGEHRVDLVGYGRD
jgi:hypothetical protein